MKKLFTERARLVIYVENADLERLTARARSEGKTLVEWGRETLLGALETGRVEDVPKRRAVRVARERTAAVAGPFDAGGKLGEGSTVCHGEVSGAEKPLSGPDAGYCPHRKQRGEVCYKCDPKMGYPSVA